MEIGAREATTEDLSELRRLYRGLEAEMKALEDLWPLADGLAEPLEAAFEAAIDADDTAVIVGTIDGIPFGFLLGRAEPMLPQADGRRIAAIRLIFTDLEAREVGVGEAMAERYLSAARAAGIELFDAHVAPGHRLAKNFFESHGFSARRIVMHRGEG
jgi:ribosomal protein S18 acetylase RimI-like enzyme